MGDDDWKAEAETRIRASIAHLSNEGKFDRERWVVERLVSRLGLEFVPEELTPADEPADVTFRDASFQVKELLDPHRKRLDEYKDELVRLAAATHRSDMHTHYEPIDLTISEVAQRIAKLAAELCRKYGPHERRQLDLLVYVNLLEAELVDEETPFAIAESPGFRSVSFVTSGMASVLWADSSAPHFIRQCVGTIQRRERSD